MLVGFSFKQFETEEPLQLPKRSILQFSHGEVRKVLVAGGKVKRRRHAQNRQGTQVKRQAAYGRCSALE